MAKLIFPILFLFCTFVCADAGSALTTPDEFKRLLGQFKPQDALPGFSSNPTEINLNPTENHDHLQDQGMASLHSNDMAAFVYTEDKKRTKVTPNPNSPEMRYAEQLIDGSDTIKEGGCKPTPPICHTDTTTERCEERVSDAVATCRDELQVTINTKTHSFLRRSPLTAHYSRFNLGACLPGESRCGPNNLLHLSAHCEGISYVTVNYKNKVVSVVQAPTCKDLGITLFTKHVPKGEFLMFTVTERSSDDVWSQGACSTLQQKAMNGTCVLQKNEPCLEPDATKIIDGFPIKRACWGHATAYQCIDHIESSCTPWINQGCSEATSTCIAERLDICMAYSKTVSCPKTTCIPQPDVCMPSLPCTDGSCDQTVNEESNDMGEGVSRLGALGGVANEVSTKQVDSNMARIFAGTAIECEKHMLGSRNCCSNDGWADWVIHCPKKTQDLRKATQEGRSVYIGEYDDGIFDTDKHFVYCVYPSTLSSIIQIQGRGQQLHIPFGKPEHPECGGITPEQLERINFNLLTLAPLEQELMSRFQTPDVGAIGDLNQTHVERLNQEGRSHD